MAFSLYKEAGVNIESISQDSNLSTGVAGIMIDENGNNAINVFAGAAAHLQNDDIDTNLDVIKKSKIANLRKSLILTLGKELSQI